MAVEVCPKCGEKVSSNWNSCPYCGRTLKEQVPFKDKEQVPFKDKEFEEEYQLLRENVARLEAINNLNESNGDNHAKAAIKAFKYFLYSLFFLVISGLLFLLLFVPFVQENLFYFVIIVASVLTAVSLFLTVVFFVMFLKEKKAALG